MPGGFHVDITEGVVYGRGIERTADGTEVERDLCLDTFVPEGAEGPRPAVVLIHGGGWRTGDRTQLRGYGVMLGRAGYVCIAPEYRLVPNASWPAQLDDARAAVHWLRSNADELGVDPDRIAVEGNSAGAHLALLLAAEADLDLRACIAVYPPTVLFHEALEDGGVPLFVLADDAASPDLARTASPLTHAGPDFPPTQLIHGTADTTVPLAASLRMFEALHAAGVAVDLHVHAEQPHAFDAVPTFGRVVAQEMQLFLDRYL